MLDEEAFRELYEATARPLRAYLRRVSGNAATADDVMQEAYLRLLRTPAGSHPAPAALLYTIATNVLRDRWRRESRERRGLLRLGTGGSSAPAEPDDSWSRVLGALKPRQRALLWLAYVEGWAHGEIAGILGIRPASVRVLLSRARDAAARRLEERGSVEGNRPCPTPAPKSSRS